jgi:hypothetical protein
MSRTTRHHRFSVLGSALLAIGCSSSTSSESGFSDAGPSAAEIYDCSSIQGLHATSISNFNKRLTHNKTSYEPLSIDGMNALITATRALDRGDIASALAAAAPADYRVLPLTAANRCYWVLQPNDSRIGHHSTLIYAPDWTRDLVIEAPHVPEDHHTDTEAVVLFETLHAKAVIIAGAARCAVSLSSGCRPTTECNMEGIPVESDPSHSVHNSLQAMHLAFRTTDAITVQLHTNIHPELNGDALVSNGTHYPAQGGPAENVYEALRSPDVDIRFCNGTPSPMAGAFCGETNSQGLASNGVADTCLGRATSTGAAAGGQFVHLEQSSWRTCRITSDDPLCVDDVSVWTRRIADALSRAINPTR